MTAASRHQRIFDDLAVDEEFATSGCVVLAEPLGTEAVRSLTALHRGVIDEVGPDGSGRFLPSMMISNAELRRRIWDGVGAAARSALPDLFLPGTVEVFGGSFVSKPNGEDGDRNPHQDPTTSDEAEAVSLSLWIPLIDSSRANGTVHVLPGSHRMGNHVRPPDVASLDAEVAETAREESVPIEVAAGSIVVIDGALVHHSPPNRSGRERVAAIVAVRTVGSAMRYVQSERGQPSGTADVFEVPVEMYRARDLVHPDLSEATLLGREPYRPVTLAELRASQAAGAGAVRPAREGRSSSDGSRRRGSWRRRTVRS